MNKLFLTCTLVLMTLGPGLAHADALDRLQEYLSETRTLRGHFSQTVVDRNGRKLQNSSGNMVFARPSLFRWVYEKPYAQIIVGDGKKVWFYDPDLEQVTVQRMNLAIGQSPAALLAGSNDIEKHFRLKDAGTSDGLEWLLATPKSGEGTFEQVRIGFRGSHIEVLELKDNLGQTSRLQFSGLQHNPALASDLFRFKPPKGVDVIGDR
ncbi:MAG: outer membrane lipoprotein chaperone LolA [Betaproteobacteria bacterium]|nr:outer membrane lipoprotein chaperone LolA [Betaproteobacteria bacterium]